MEKKEFAGVVLENENIIDLIRAAIYWIDTSSKVEVVSDGLYRCSIADEVTVVKVTPDSIGTYKLAYDVSENSNLAYIICLSIERWSLFLNKQDEIQNLIKSLVRGLELSKDITIDQITDRLAMVFPNAVDRFDNRLKRLLWFAVIQIEEASNLTLVADLLYASSKWFFLLLMDSKGIDIGEYSDIDYYFRYNKKYKRVLAEVYCKDLSSNTVILLNTLYSSYTEECIEDTPKYQFKQKDRDEQMHNIILYLYKLVNLIELIAVSEKLDTK